MDFFCLPILCGCSNQVHQEGNDPRVCPRCNNVAVQPVKNRQMFELFCIPLCPMNSSHEWRCGICQWAMPRNGGFQPMQPGQYPQQQQFMQPGYQQPQQGYYQQPPMMQGYKPPQ